MRAIALILFATLAGIVSATEFIPEERTAIVPKEKALDFVHRLCFEVPSGITGFWTPTPKDSEGIEAGLIAYLEKVRPEAAQWFTSESGRKLKDGWSWFRRQAIGVLKGEERFLLIAYDCEYPAETAQKEKDLKAKAGARYQPDWWKNSPLRGNDGGYRWFRVLFDLKRREFVWHEENNS